MTDYPTLKKFLSTLGTERDCRSRLRKIRWPQGDCCPRCGDQLVSNVFSGLNAKARFRGLYRCWVCDYHFSETAGTIFHDTHLNLRDWFLAIYLMGSIEQGARVAQLEKCLGVSHETAVNMAKRIRAAIKQDKNFVQRCVQPKPAYYDGLDRPTPNRNLHPTLHAVVFKFRTEEITRQHVMNILWPNGATCPKCLRLNVRKVKNQCRRNRHLYWCLLCKKQFSLTSGNRYLKGIRCLSEWLIALYLMETTPRGVPPKQLERLLGINYRTGMKLVGWFRGKEEDRTFLFNLYIGPNDPAAYIAIRETIKKERRLIEKQKGNSPVGTKLPSESKPEEIVPNQAKPLPSLEPPKRSEPTPEVIVFRRRGIDE